MSDRDVTALDPGDRALADLALQVRAMRADSVNGARPHGGSATIDFGTTPTQEASVAVVGQAAIAAGSFCKAWIGGTTADNDGDAHLVASNVVSLTVESVVAGTGFTIRALNRDQAMTKTFNVYWEWF